MPWQKERKEFLEEKREYNADALLIAFVTLLSLLYSFTFSGVASHYRDAQALTTKEADMGSELSRWSRHFDDVERRKFQLMLTEYFEIRTDIAKSRDTALVTKYHDNLWMFLMDKEKKETDNDAAIKMLTDLESSIHFYWTQYYAEKDRLPLPIIVMIFSASMLITFFVGYSNLNSDSHFTVNLFIFISLNMIIMITIRELDMMYQGLIMLNRENISEIARSMRELYNSGK